MDTPAERFSEVWLRALWSSSRGLLAWWDCASGAGAAMASEQTHQRVFAGPLLVSGVGG